MKDTSIVPVQSVEYIEYAVRDVEKASGIYDKMGFTCTGMRSENNRRSKLYMQGDIRIVLTASSSEKDPAFQFSRRHGDGVIEMGLRVPNADEAHRLACKRGAQSAQNLEITRGRSTTMQRSAIKVFGDVTNAFVSYEGPSARFDEMFTENYQPLDTVKGKYLQTVDHVTVNLEKGELNRWADFYKDVFGFTEVRYFDIRTDKSGLLSRAMRSPSGRVTMPFNEPTNSKSQIQEFIDTFHGPGVQHIAFHTSGIINCLEEYMRQGFKFLTVPGTYYDAVPKRVPNVVEDMETLKRLNILVDGSDKGYLLQIFTENVVGPFFFELIQRKGDNGFGDGNFRALFEAIERDQERRGVI